MIINLTMKKDKWKNCFKYTNYQSSFKKQSGASLVVQWLRICLAMQGTLVWSLIWEDSTCLRATKPVCYNYQAHTLAPVLCNKKPLQWKVRALRRRVAPTHYSQTKLECSNKDPVQLKINKQVFKKRKEISNGHTDTGGEGGFNWETGVEKYTLVW